LGLKQFGINDILYDQLNVFPINAYDGWTVGKYLEVCNSNIYDRARSYTCKNYNLYNRTKLEGRHQDLG
jgi:hypothetical protein